MTSSNPEISRMSKAIGKVLAEPEPTSVDKTETVVPQLEVETKIESAEPPKSLAPEIEVQPPQVSVPSPTQFEEPNPFDEESPVAFAEKPESIPEAAWKKVYPGYAFLQDLKKPFEEGGIGHAPTVDDVHQYFNAYSDRVQMEEDFISGDANAGAGFIARWFGLDPNTGTARPNAENVAAVIPYALAQSNPQAFNNMVAALPSVLGHTDPQTLTSLAASLPSIIAQANTNAFAQMSFPILSSYRDQLWNRWQNERDPNARETLYRAAQAMTFDTTGAYRQFDAQGKVVETAQPKADTSALDAQRRELESMRQQIANEQAEITTARAQQWQNFMASDVDRQVDPLIDLALKPLKSISGGTGPYNAAKRDFTTMVQGQVKKDPKWSVYVGLVKQAFRSSSQGLPTAAEDEQAVGEFYKEMAHRAIMSLRGSFLSEWGVTAKKQSEQRHQELGAIDQHREPSAGGPPAPQRTQPTENRRMKKADGSWETQEEFTKRVIQNAMQ
jgi:Tfp pilus assembly protein FimT